MWKRQQRDISLRRTGRTLDQRKTWGPLLKVFLLLFILLAITSIVLLLSRIFSIVSRSDGEAIVLAKGKIGASQQEPINHVSGLSSSATSQGDGLGLPPCSQVQMSHIREMLPSQKAIQQNTKCPRASWANEGPWLTKFKQVNEPLVSIYVGCNKGMDAVNTLRMYSRDPRIDKRQWRTSVNASFAACGQMARQHQIPPGQSIRKAHVHCIEAMPNNFQQLDKSCKELGWTDSLHIHHLAMADTNGKISFPNGELGAEHLGIYACSDPQYKHMCQEVPMISLDTFAKDQAKSGMTLDQSWMIDFLSVDVEGNDWPVLKGATETLSRTKYLEFEYHWNGVWANTNLSTAIDFLKPLKFRCYWAGKDGQLWRISGCFRPEYNIFKPWSNVACVQVDLAPDLAKIMEDHFLKTIAAPHSSGTL